MPMIGNIQLPDDYFSGALPPPAPRPSLGAIFGAAARQTIGQLRYGLPLQAETLTGEVTPADENYYRQKLGEVAAQGAKAAPSSLSDVLAGKVNPLRFAAEQVAGSAPFILGGLAGGAAGAVLGGPPGAVAGGLAASVPLFSAQNVAEAVQQQGGLSPAAAERALIAAPVQSAAQLAVEQFAPGAGKIFGDLVPQAGGNLVRRVITNAVEAGATGAVATPIQVAGSRYAAGQPLSGTQALSDYVGAAVAGFAAGGLIGAAGGIRRTPAVAKPANDVTNQDLTQYQDQVLALPAPPDFTTNPAGVTQVNPSGTVQLALPPPDHFAQPDVYVDASGRAVPAGQVTPVALANLPRPGSVLDLSGALNVDENSAIQNALQAGLPNRAPQEEPFQAPNVLARPPQRFEPPPAAQVAMPDVTTGARPFAQEPIADLRSVTDQAAKGRQISPELLDMVHAELDSRQQELVGAAPLTVDSFQTRLDEAKEGLRKNNWLSNLKADSPEDLFDKVYNQLYVEQDDRVGTRQLGEKLGLIDADQTPGPEAVKIAVARETTGQGALQPAQKEPEGPAAGGGGQVAAAPPAVSPTTPETPPVSTEAKPSVPENEQTGAIPPLPPGVEPQKTVLSRIGKPDQASDPLLADAIRQSSNDDQLRQNLMASLGRVATTDTENIKPQTEGAAFRLGLITKPTPAGDWDYTPLARSTWLKSADGFEDIVNAAQAQGFDGKLASMFDRGVKSTLGGPEETGFSDFKDMAAYQAGKVWSKDFVENTGKEHVATTAETQAFMGRIRGANELTPGQVQQQSLNQALDAANLSSLRDSDVAALRRMIRDGASPDEVQHALEQVQGGKTLFRQPESAPYEAPAAATSRGQPRFQELATRPERSKSELRAETALATRKYNVRQEARAAFNSGDLSAGDFARISQRLDTATTKEHVDAAVRLLPGFGKAKETQGASGDAKFEQAVDGKSFNDVVDHLIQTAPGERQRKVLEAARNLIGDLKKMGMTFDFKIIHQGDEAPPELASGRSIGYTSLQANPAHAAVYLRGVDLGHSGADYETAAHEVVHAATMLGMFAGNDPDNHAPRVTKAANDLTRLMNEVKTELEARRASGQPLTPFEDKLARSRNNALLDTDELLAWGLTNPDMQQFLSSIEYAPKQSFFQKLVDGVRKLLNLPPRYSTALDELLRVAQDVFAAPNDELESSILRYNRMGEEMSKVSPVEMSAANRTVEASNDTTKGVADMLGQVVDRLPVQDFKVKARRLSFGWLSHNQLDRLYGDRVRGTVEHTEAHRFRGAVRTRFEMLGNEAYQRFEKIERENPKLAQQIVDLMELSTVFQIDPTKPFEAHEHLGLFVNDANGKPIIREKLGEEAARMRDIYDRAVKLKNDLSRGDQTGIFSFNEFKTLNEAQNFARMAAGIHSLVAMDPELRLGIESQNPTDLFMRTPDHLVADAKQVRDWWDKELARQTALAENYLREQRGRLPADASKADKAKWDEHLSPIDMHLQAIAQARAKMAQSPYFHLGRFGDNFVAFMIKRDDKGVADPAAVQRVAQALYDAKVVGAQISPDNAKPRVYMRFESIDQTNAIKQLGLELERQGLVEKDSTVGGPRNTDKHFGVFEGMPAYVARYIQNIEASPMFKPGEDTDPMARAALERNKQEAIQLAIDTWLEAQPDNSIAKVLTKRYTVQGYTKDMVRSFAHRWRVGTISLANVAAAPKFNQAFSDMRAQYEEALSAKSTDDAYLVRDLRNELQLRDATVPIRETANSFDKLRAITHGYFLGMSPAYGLVNISQIGVVGIPELAKQHGYMKSFAAVRRAEKQARAVLAAAGSEAMKLDPRHRADVAITGAVLTKANLPVDVREFIMHAQASGLIDIGSAARSFGQIAEGRSGSGLDVTLRYASAVGLYTEMYSRLTMALAARDLHGGSGEAVQKYATKVVANSMFDYQSWNTARLLGKNGILGPVTPIVTQFMQYSVQMVEKLFSEMHDALGQQRPGESSERAAERRSQSRTFLLGHLTAVAALSGTLGLPFATVFASAIERLANAWDDDDFDATAAWRNFLAGVLGKPVAEVVSRGLPRAMGVDLSQRAGEQDLLPFSSFLADKRSWQDAVDNLMGRGIGASPNMILNVLQGGQQMAQGDVLGGMKEIMPVAFKSPIEAYRMTTDGYTDSKGNKLPLTPKAADILWQLIGFTPSQKAEYGEARGDQAIRSGELQRTAGTLRQQIISAIQSGDQSGAHDLVGKAIQFDQSNPAFAVLPGLYGAMQGQARARAQAVALQTPLGVSLKDVAGQRLTRYANVRETQ